MKIIVIGSTGTIGTAVIQALAPRHEVIGISRHSQPSIDLDNAATVATFFRTVTGIDAIVVCAGSATFKPLEQLTDDDFTFSLRSKLMGQVNVIRQALPQIKDGGSITVTSGVLAQKPAPGGSAVSLVNAALEGFVRGAALEAPRGIRINAVSPPWVNETLAKLKMTGPTGLPAAVVAKAYVAVVEGKQQGEVIAPA